MARIVPSDLTQLALSGAHEPEIQTLALLRDRLPEAYTVFHGVHWTRQYKGRTLYGEIDFVVVNQAGQVLCIEQKNGGLEETAQGLFKAYGDERKSVGDQILRSVDNIREKFAYQVGKRPGLEIEYLVYCPDHTLKQLSAAGLDRERIVDAPKREKLAEHVQTVLPSTQGTQDTWAQQVAAFFRQTFEVVPDVHAHIDAQEKTYTRLSHGLLEVLASLEMQPLRLQVLATAGNGKTLVARHFFDQCIAQGGRPLLLCFNRPLAERLGHLVTRGGLVATWYQFCDQFLQSRGIQLDFEAMRTQPDFWHQAATQLEEQALTATLGDAWRFDTLIVDEAQDFEAGWLEALRLFLREDATMLWLEDPNQNVRGVAPPALLAQGFVGYRSLLNYRSPEGIARFVNGVLPELPFTCANDLPGLGAGTLFYQDPTEQPRLVGRIVGRLLNARFRPQDIAILSCRGLESTALKEAQRVGNHTLARFTGDYDLFGNQVYSKGQVLFDTVRRFKGQQAAAVILTDVAPRAHHLAQELQVLFCGMTRATVRLDLVCDRSNAWVKERLAEWA
ncbi:ATP-binding domain-containing protein [Thiorhodococcus mannitoliphagus]|uniref:DNA 3'-5' helicase II n=1 Tax=Thiorhodococcus mannitoliphagus TaxID=329406 RepID=A0A6P1E4M2_9GAMM|nr:ATP-binding domain-containing protein [Thiorhodococcus mannitoliphagus]NEX23482.1 ATP-binding domain-containing protein [Thiorhodococcus mannitoliphagus]